MSAKERTLIVITGPTASGKSTLAVGLARHYGCDIISADSRQIYRGMPICTAAPTPDQLAAVPHHFVAMLEPTEYYSAACFEAEAMRLLEERLWAQSAVQVVCGGSMLYVDALTRGIDEIPTISDEVRAQCIAMYESEGLEGIYERLKALDGEYAAVVDRANPRRVIHALEICLQSGGTYTALRTGQVKPRPFRIVTFAIDYPREQLFDRINARVDAMVAEGLEEEARSLYHLRHLNALNTVGYKEMFAYFDGTMSRDTAIERIKKNTRVFAKKQLTWMKQRSEIGLLDPSLPMLPQVIDNI